MQAASSWNRNEIATLFLDSSAKIDPGALAIAALGGNSNQVRMLLAHGADPNAGRGNVLKWTHGAAETNSDAFVKQIGFPTTQEYVRVVMRRRRANDGP